MAELSNQEMVAIVDEMLEQTRVAAFTRDFDLFSQWCALPHTITTFEKKRTIETMDELKAVFFAQCDNFAAMQVTDMVRKCEAAKLEAPDCIHEMHTTNLMSGDSRVADPYPAYMELAQRDGAWRVSKSDYAVKAGSGFEIALGKDPKETSGPEAEKK